MAERGNKYTVEGKPSLIYAPKRNWIPSHLQRCDEGMKRRTSVIHLNLTSRGKWLVGCARITPFTPTEWEEKAGAAVRLRRARTGVHSDVQPVLSHGHSTQSVANCSRGQSSNNSWNCFTLRAQTDVLRKTSTTMGETGASPSYKH